MIVKDLTEKKEKKPKYEYELTHIYDVNCGWTEIYEVISHNKTNNWDSQVSLMIKFSEGLIGVNFHDSESEFVIYKGTLTINE